MAIIDGLTTLAAVKLEAGISDSTQDSLLEALINSCSAAIKALCNREIARTTHTDERYSVSGSQNLYLSEYPVQSVTSVILGGVLQTANVDYRMDARDAAAGRLYRPNGWVGNYFTRGTFPDVFSGARDIVATYVAGWYLPADVTVAPADPHYVAGASDSLPLAISYAATRAVVTRFCTIRNQADGVKSYSEGGISTTWFGPEAIKAGGFDAVVSSMLAPYIRREAA